MSIFKSKFARTYVSGIIVCTGSLAAFGAQAQTAEHIGLMAQAPIPALIGSQVTKYDKFVPQTATKFAKLDYQVWDEALKNVVLDLGPSLRKRARRPSASIGSRFIHGHKSAYRLEGSRVTFSYINEEYRQGLTDYRKDLEDIATRVDITKFPRNEQLAFWFNLHNVAILEQIALAYPIDRPSNLKVKLDGSKVPLDDAKFITVKDTKLSLRDIRENIVYKNWSNPNVIYGFFRGNIGSPKMPRVAYTASSIDYLLEDNALEFVNALRGFHEARNTRNISIIYEEAKPFFFKNWDADLTAHLLKYAERETVVEVQSGKPFKSDRYDTMIADLSGGRRLGSSGNAVKGAGTMSVETARLLSEVREKQRRLRIEGIVTSNPNRGYVIIEDLDPNETLTNKTESSDPK